MNNKDTYDHRFDKSLAQLGLSQRDAFVGKGSGKNHQKSEEWFEPSLELQNRSFDVMANLVFLASDELNQALKNAEPGYVAQAFSIVKEEFKQQTGSYKKTRPIPVGRRKGFDVPPAVSRLILLLLMFATSLGLWSCVPQQVDNTSPPPTVPAESTPAPKYTETAKPTRNPITGLFTPSPEAPIEGTKTKESSPTQMEIVYPDSYEDWIDAGDSKTNRATLETLVPGDPKRMEDILAAKAKEMEAKDGTKIKIGQYLYGVTANGWSIVILDTNGQIWYAVGTTSKLPFAQLAGFGKDFDEWTLSTNPLSAPGNSQRLLKDKDEKGLFSYEEIDKNGKVVSWMDLETGMMMKVIDIRLSLEKAKQAVAETISIKGDYGYNQNGGVVTMFDDEKGDWIPIPFGEEDLDDLARMQFVGGGGNLYTQGMIVAKVHEYGDPNLTNPNKGAKPIRNSLGEIVAYVALSVDGMSQNSQGGWQVAEIPVVLYSADGKKIVIFDSVFEVSSGSWIEELGLEGIKTFLLPQVIHSTLTEEEKALYDDPNKWGTNLTDKKPQLGMGDKIGVEYSKKGLKSGVPYIAKRMEALGITLSDLNDPEGFAKYLETGNITFLSDDDLILIMLFPDGVIMYRDAVNQ